MNAVFICFHLHCWCTYNSIFNDMHEMKVTLLDAWYIKVPNVTTGLLLLLLDGSCSWRCCYLNHVITVGLFYRTIGVASRYVFDRKPKVYYLRILCNKTILNCTLFLRFKKV